MNSPDKPNERENEKAVALCGAGADADKQEIAN
jgi:hypothetical protein